LALAKFAHVMASSETITTSAMSRKDALTPGPLAELVANIGTAHFNMQN
jgi:hypothetical protein